MNFKILIPFYNEENTLYEVAKTIKQTGYPFLFINDGSTDTSKKIIRNYETYEYYPNQGKGFAIKYGAQVIINQGYDWILVMDSDGQNNVSDISQFISTLSRYPDAKIIIGNRLQDPKNMPIIRYLTNKFMSWIISLLSNQQVPDSQCGMRLVHKNVFLDINLESDRFELESEMLIKAGRVGFPIVSVPIKCIYKKERESKINPLPDIIRFIKMLINF